MDPRPLAHQRQQVQLGLGTGPHPDHGDPPAGGERLQVLGQVGRADQLEDHVEGAVLGEPLAVDRLGAEPGHLVAQLRAANGRRHLGAGRTPELDRGRAHAAGAPVHQQALSGGQPRLREERVVGGREDLRQAARRRPSPASRGRASARARARRPARPGRPRRRSPSRARRPRSARRPHPSETTSPASSMPGMSWASREAPGTGRASASCRRRSSPAAWTRTSTSPVPATGSGWSSTRISCVADRRGPHRPRTLLALQQRDALDVVGLGEHVDRANPAAATNPAATISAALGASVVGLQDTYTIRLGLDSMIRWTTFFESPARGRIDDHQVGTTGALHQLGQRRAGVAGEEVGVGDPVAARPRRSRRRRRVRAARSPTARRRGAPA